MQCSINYDENPVSGFVTHLLDVLPLPQMFKPSFFCDKNNYKGMHEKINKLIADEKWIEIDLAMSNINQGPFSDDSVVLGELFSKIILPQKHWKTLEKGEWKYSALLLRIIENIVIYGDKASIFNYFSESNGVQVIEKCVQKQQCTEMEQIFCLNILRVLVHKTGDPQYAKLTVPVAVRFKDMVEEGTVGFSFMLQGVQLIFILSDCEGSEEVILDVFKLGIVSYAVKVLTTCQKLKQETPLEGILTIWYATCKTIVAVLSEESYNFNKVHVPILTLNIVEVMRNIAIDEKEYQTIKFDTIDNAVHVLWLLIQSCEQVNELNAIKEYGVVKEVVNAMVVILQDDELKSRYHELIHNSIKIIRWMMNVEPDVTVVAPALSTIHELLNQDPTSYSTLAEFIAEFCNRAVDRGSPEDVKYLLNHGLIPLMAKLRDYLVCDRTLFGLIYALYDVILKVPDTDELSHINNQLYNTLFTLYFSCPAGKCEHENGHETELIILAFVIAAIGISSICYTDEERYKSLDLHFQRKFKEIQDDKITIEFLYPESFMIKKMAKVNCFKSSVLPHIWYIAEHGPDELMKDLFEALPHEEENTKVANLEEMKEQVLKYVLVEIKEVFERKLNYKRFMLIRLTGFLTTIPCNEQGDTVLYHLEDLVSPCLGLLEDQNEKRIVNNVKKFINNLHYS